MTELPFSSELKTETKSEPEIAAPGRSRDFWFIYLLFIGFTIGAVMMLPTPASSVLLVAAVLLAVVFIARDAEISFRQLIALPFQAIRAFNKYDTDAVTQDELRTWAGTLVTLIATSMMFWAANLMRPNQKDEFVNQGVIILIVGGVLMGIAMWLYRYNRPGLAITDQALTPARSRPGIALVGVLLLVFLAEVNGNLLGLKMMVSIPHRIQFALLVAGAGMLVLGLGGVENIFARLKMLNWRGINWRYHLPLLLIFVLALFLRTVNLHHDLRSAVDEAVVMNGINHVVNTRDAGIVTQVSSYLSATQVFPYWQTEIIGLTGRTLFGWRLTNALVGSLTVFAVYLLAEALFNRRTALIAAFMLAVFPPHIHFSRIAMAHITDPMMGTLVFAFIARGLRDNRRVDWVLAGVALGFTQYFFEGGRLLFPILTGGWIFLLLLLQKRWIAAHARGLVLMGLTAFLIMMPVYYTLFARNVSRTTRLDASGVGTSFWSELVDNGISMDDVRIIAQRFLSPLLIYIHQQEIQFYYGGPTAIFLEAVAPLFFLTMFYLLWRWRRPEAFLAIWVILAAVANGVVKDSFVYARYVVVFPALAIVLAVGIQYVLPLIIPLKKERWVNALALVVIGAITITQLNYYYGTHIPYFQQQLRTAKPYRDGYDAILRTLDFPLRTQVLIISDPENDRNVLRPFFGYYWNNEPTVTMDTYDHKEFSREFLHNLPRDRNYAFFLAPDDAATLAMISEYFVLQPAQYSPYTDVPSDREYVLYFAPLYQAH